MCYAILTAIQWQCAIFNVDLTIPFALNSSPLDKMVTFSQTIFSDAFRE